MHVECTAPGGVAGFIRGAVVGFAEFGAAASRVILARPLGPHNDTATRRPCPLPVAFKQCVQRFIVVS